jgi:hypothetical protein
MGSGGDDRVWRQPSWAGVRLWCCTGGLAPPRSRRCCESRLPKTSWTPLGAKQGRQATARRTLDSLCRQARGRLAKGELPGVGRLSPPSCSGHVIAGTEFLTGAPTDNAVRGASKHPGKLIAWTEQHSFAGLTHEDNES